MIWIILSILAAILWTSSNLIDKYILDKYIRQPLICLITLGLVGLISSIAIFIKNFVYLSSYSLILSFIGGLIYVAILTCYLKALKMEEASRVVPLFSLNAIFVLILASLFLDEILTPIEYFGVFLLVCGAILISIKRSFKLRNTKAFWLMILAAILSALFNVLTKYLLNFADYWTIFSYTRLGSFFSILPLIYIYMPELKKTLRIYGKRVLGFMTATQIINIFGLLSFTAAISFGYVSLVVGINQIQPLFVFLFASILSIFYPKILKEEVKGPIILLKVVAIILMIAGVTLIT